MPKSLDSDDAGASIAKTCTSVAPWWGFLNELGPTNQVRATLATLSTLAHFFQSSIGNLQSSFCLTEIPPLLCARIEPAVIESKAIQLRSDGNRSQNSDGRGRAGARRGEGGQHRGSPGHGIDA